MAIALWLVAAEARAESLVLEIASARAAYDRALALNVIDITLRPASTQAFAAYTAAHVGERIELRSDRKVLMTVVVRDPILQGVLRISGSFDADEAAQIAARLLLPDAGIEVETVAK